MEINRTHLTEVDTHVFLAEASCLGLPPGQFPKELEVSGLGNGQPFRSTGRLPCGGVAYRQVLGCVVVKILND